MARHGRALVLLILLASCASTDGRGPEDHILIFGSLRVDSMLLAQPVDRVVIARTDPAGLKTVIEACVQGNMFFTEPLPAGEGWRIESFTAAEEELRVRVELCAEAPGLVFAGSLEVFGDLPGALQVRPRDFPDERTLLQDLLDVYRGTAWEALIRGRIRSLDRDSKS